MVSRQSQSIFALVPTGWFDLVVGVWTVLLAVGGLKLTFAGAERLLGPPQSLAWMGVLVTIVVAGFGYAVFGIGVTVLYQRRRGFKHVLGDGLGGRSEWLWVGGLGVVAGGLISTSAILAMLLDHPERVLAPMIAVGSPPIFAGGIPLGLGITGVNAILTEAPNVLFIALLAGVFIGPAVAALIHGILQDVFSRATSAESAVVLTAVGSALLLEPNAVTSLTTPHEAVSAGVIVCFVGAVAYVYRVTDRLIVAMAAYGVFNVLTVVFGWATLVATLYQRGHLFG